MQVRFTFQLVKGLSRSTPLIKKKATTMKNLNLLNVEEKKDFFNSVDTVLTDCDGVLWLGEKPIPGATDVINKLKNLGKNVFFVTNNSTKTREDLCNKSQRLGFEITVDEMISSSWLTAIYLKSRNFQKKAYVIGVKSICDELQAAGIESFGYGPDPLIQPSIYQEPIGVDDNVGAVVVGHDIHFSYPKMVKACNYLKDSKNLFIATNPDPSLPLPGNRIVPGAGAFVAAIETCVGRKPIIAGKPSTVAVVDLLKSKGLDPKRALMIGDRCTTDIAFGNEGCMKTLLVLSGVNNLNHIKTYEENDQKHLLPTYYADSIADLINVIKA